MKQLQEEGVKEEVKQVEVNAVNMMLPLEWEDLKVVHIGELNEKEMVKRQKQLKKQSKKKDGKQNAGGGTSNQINSIH